MPAVFLARGGTIHNILVIAETPGFGVCLTRVLRAHRYLVSITVSYGNVSGIVQDMALGKFDLVIVTNTSLSPARILSIVPDIKSRHPHVRIIVLSGHHPEGFVADLKHNGVDGFLPIPFEEDVLLEKVALLLPRQQSDLSHSS